MVQPHDNLLGPSSMAHWKHIPALSSLPSSSSKLSSRLPLPLLDGTTSYSSHLTNLQTLKTSLRPYPLQYSFAPWLQNSQTSGKLPDLRIRPITSPAPPSSNARYLCMNEDTIRGNRSLFHSCRNAFKIKPLHCNLSANA